MSVQRIDCYLPPPSTNRAAFRGTGKTGFQHHRDGLGRYLAKIGVENLQGISVKLDCRRIGVHRNQIRRAIAAGRRAVARVVDGDVGSSRLDPVEQPSLELTPAAKYRNQVRLRSVTKIDDVALANSQRPRYVAFEALGIGIGGDQVGNVPSSELFGDTVSTRRSESSGGFPKKLSISSQTCFKEGATGTEPCERH